MTASDGFPATAGSSDGLVRPDGAVTSSAWTQVPRCGFWDQVAAELVKLRTLRSTVAVAVALGLALPVLALVVGLTGSLAPDDTVLGASLLGGAALAQLLAVTLGALLVTSETRSGTMRATLLASPDYLVVLAAKSVLAVAVTLGVTLPSAWVAYGLGLATVDQSVHATGQPWPAVLGVSLAIATIAVLGVGLGAVVRHSAAAVGLGVAVVLGPSLVAPLFGDLQRWVGGASSNGVLQKLTQSSDATAQTVGSLGAWPSLAVVAGYTCVVGAVAVGLRRHRDS